MPVYHLGGVSPSLPDLSSFWLAPSAELIGDVHLEDDVSIWFAAVLRGDNAPIIIKNGTNIQDGTIIHTDPGNPVIIGSNCTIGHKAIIHGCTIGDTSLVGMGATILNGAEIGSCCMIGANSLVTQNKKFPDRSFILGSPARFIRHLNDEEVDALAASAHRYQQKWKHYQQDLKTPSHERK